MKKIAIILVIALFFGLSSDTSAQGKTRKEKKRERQEKIEQQYQFTKEVLKGQKFVLEADYLQNKYGTRVPVSSIINFIKVDSGEAVLQIGNPFGRGYNGVGGVTAEGRITSYKMDENDKNNTFDINMSILSSLGNYDIFMNIGADGYASATLTGLRGGKLIYSGEIVHNLKSGIYKGSTSY